VKKVRESGEILLEEGDFQRVLVIEEKERRAPSQREGDLK
jgi:hypothetical protein